MTARVLSFYDAPRTNRRYQRVARISANIVALDRAGMFDEAEGVRRWYQAEHRAANKNKGQVIEIRRKA